MDNDRTTVVRAILVGMVLVSSCLVLVGDAIAQPPGPPNGGRQEPSQTATLESFLTRLFTLDTNGDGQISRAECTDLRLAALLGRADADRDGRVTKAELTALYERESAALRATDRRGPGGPGGPGGFGPPRGGPPPGGGPPPRRPRP